MYVAFASLLLSAIMAGRKRAHKSQISELENKKRDIEEVLDGMAVEYDKDRRNSSVGDAINNLKLASARTLPLVTSCGEVEMQAREERDELESVLPGAVQ